MNKDEHTHAQEAHNFYKIISTVEAQKILDVLSKNKRIQLTALLKKTELQDHETKFHTVLKQLHNYGLVNRYVLDVKHVEYSLNAIGKEVLKRHTSLYQFTQTKLIPMKQKLFPTSIKTQKNVNRKNLDQYAKSFKKNLLKNGNKNHHISKLPKKNSNIDP